MKRGLTPDYPEPGCVDPDAFVNAWVGTPFEWDGRTIKGVDCWGLVWRFYHDCLGVTLPDWTIGAGGQPWVDAKFAVESAEHWRSFTEPRDFCLVLCLPAKRPAHIGVYWRGGVLHAARGGGARWEALAHFQLSYPNAEFGEYDEGIA